MRKFIGKLLLSAVVVAGLSHFAGADDKMRISMEGSTTVLPIAQATAEAFMNKNPNIMISVRGGGSGVGISSFIAKSCDIGNSSRSIKAAEVKSAQANGLTAKSNVIAMDGLAVILNPANTITALTKKQIKDIYTGVISDWKDVGGAAGKIVVMSRDSSSGSFEAFGSLALDGAKVRGDALMDASNQGIATKVANTPGAIGYVGIGYISDAVKAVTVNGIVCSKDTVLSGKYPLSRPLFMITNGEPTGAVKQYIDFVLSAEGQKLVGDTGFVPFK